MAGCPASRHVAAEDHLDADVPADSRAIKPNAVDRVQLTPGRSCAVERPNRRIDFARRQRDPSAQARPGTRLTYNFTRQIAATLRTSTDRRPPRRRIRRWRPSPADRQHPGMDHRRTPTAARQLATAATISPCSSRAASTSGQCRGGSASTRTLQGGIVGVRTATSSSTVNGVHRPVYKRFSAEFGVWAEQPGILPASMQPPISVRAAPCPGAFRLAAAPRAGDAPAGLRARRSPSQAISSLPRSLAPATVAGSSLPRINMYLPIPGQSVNALFIIVLGFLVGVLFGNVRRRRRLSHARRC